MHEAQSLHRSNGAANTPGENCAEIANGTRNFRLTDDNTIYLPSGLLNPRTIRSEGINHIFKCDKDVQINKILSLIESIT